MGRPPTSPSSAAGLPRRPAAVDAEAGAGDGSAVVGAQVPHQGAHLGSGEGGGGGGGRGAADVVSWGIAGTHVSAACCMPTWHPTRLTSSGFTKRLIGWSTSRMSVITFSCKQAGRQRAAAAAAAARERARVRCREQRQRGGSNTPWHLRGEAEVPCSSCAAQRVGRGWTTARHCHRLLP